MKWLLDFLWRALRSPSAFEDDWRRFALNQSGHILAGAALTLLLPWWLIIAAYLSWEAVQIRRFGADLWDAAEDTGFVAGGVLAAAAHDWRPAAVAALFLLAGALRRAANSGAGGVKSATKAAVGNQPETGD